MKLIVFKLLFPEIVKIILFRKDRVHCTCLIWSSLREVFKKIPKKEISFLENQIRSVGVTDCYGNKIRLTEKYLFCCDCYQFLSVLLEIYDSNFVGKILNLNQGIYKKR